MARWSTIFAILAVLASAPAAAPAAACEAGICVEKTFPAEGDEVTFSAQLWVFFDNVNGHDMGAVLRDEDGQVVPTTATVSDQGTVETLMRQLLHVMPDEPLEPYSDYRLDLVIEEDLCAGSVPDQISFSTGGLLDTQAPDAEGVAGVEARTIADYANGSNCTLGPPRHRYTVHVEPVADAVAYRLYEGGQLVAVAPAGPRVDGGGAGRLEDAVELDLAGEGEPPDRCFVMRPVDLAGNEYVGDEEHCLEPPAGDDDDDGGGSGSQGGQACFCHAESDPSSAGMVVAGMLAVLLVRRR